MCSAPKSRAHAWLQEGRLGGGNGKCKGPEAGVCSAGAVVMGDGLGWAERRGGVDLGVLVVNLAFLSSSCGSFLKTLLHLLQYGFFFRFWCFGPEVRGVLVPRPGLEPTLLALEGEVFTAWPPGTSREWLL